MPKVKYTSAVVKEKWRWCLVLARVVVACSSWCGHIILPLFLPPPPHPSFSPSFTASSSSSTSFFLIYAACGRIIEPRVYVVFAGYEHAKFINYFPFWQVDVGVVASNKQHVTVRYSHRSEAADELQKLSRDRYTLKELQARPLPEGVDPKRLETYLGEEEFNVSAVTTRLTVMTEGYNQSWPCINVAETITLTVFDNITSSFCFTKWKQKCNDFFHCTEHISI